jgi:hypothetical protein
MKNYGGHNMKNWYDKPQNRADYSPANEAFKHIQSNAAYIGSYSTPEDLIKTSPQDNDWVLRSADGNGQLILFNGDTMTDAQVNEMKAYYKTAQDLHYFQSRPIKYSNWIKLSDHRKMASRIR